MKKLPTVEDYIKEHQLESTLETIDTLGQQVFGTSYKEYTTYIKDDPDLDGINLIITVYIESNSDNMLTLQEEFIDHFFDEVPLAHLAHLVLKVRYLEARTEVV